MRVRRGIAEAAIETGESRPINVLEWEWNAPLHGDRRVLGLRES